jgi:glycosyltransferase involved in cell wall biosynthesis
MKVGIATGDWAEGSRDQHGAQILGGSGHIRLGQFLPYTAHNYVIGELAWHPDEEIFGVRDWDGEDHFDIDLLIMQRWMHHTIPERIKIVQAKGQVIVNDLDDWYWGLSEKNLAFQSSHPRVNPKENTNHYKKTLSKSDAVIVSTQYLADRISKFVKPDNIFLLENHVELDKFRLWEHTESEKPVVGWLGSTGHRSGDLEILKALYRKMGTERWAYHHSGHIGWMNHFYTEVGLEKGDVTILFPVPSPKLGQQMRFDIGVVPLTDVPFNRAKSWIKGLEYAAAGIPFIASPVEPYVELKKRYGVGIVPKNVVGWQKAFESLRDPETRKEIASDNLRKIQSLDAPYGAAKGDAIINEIWYR